MKSLKLSHLAVLFTFFVLTLFVAIAPQEVQAANNPFSSFTQGIQERWSKLMLRLPGNKSGREVLGQSLRASEKLTSADINWEVKADFLNESNTSLGTFAVALGGPATFNSLANPTQFSQQAKLTGEVSADNVNTKAAAELFIEPKALYVKLTELPDLGESIPPDALAQLLNQWVYMPAGTEAEISEQQTTTTNPEVAAKMSDAAKKLMNAATISQAKREKLDGAGVFAVDVTIPDDAVLTYIKDVEAATGRTSADGNVWSNDTSVKRFLDGSSEFKTTMYVDDATFYLRKVMIPLTFDFSAMMAETNAQSVDLSPVGISEEPTRMKLDITVNMSRFNEQFSLQPPTEFVPVSEFMNSMVPASPTVESQRRMPARPAELPELTEQEKAMLKEYGLEVEDLY